MPADATFLPTPPQVEPVNRRSVLRWAVPALAAGVAWPALASRGRLSVKIALPKPPHMGVLPLQLAGELGYLDAEGLDVQWVPVHSDAAAAQALASGRVQAAAVDFTQVLFQWARGVDLCAVVQQTRSPLRVLGIHPRLVQGLPKQGGALKGRRVGTLSDLSCQLVINRTLQMAGLTSTDLTVHTLADPAEVLEQYRQGALDAFCLDPTVAAALEIKGEVKVVADTRTVRGTTDVLGGPVPGMSVCVLRQNMSQQHGLCQALAHAVVRALKWLRTAGPSDLTRMLPESTLGPDRAQYLAAFEKSRDGLSTDGLMADVAASSALLAMLRLDTSLTRLHPLLPETYTNEYALKAKQRFRA